MSTALDPTVSDDVIAVGPPRRRRNSWVLAGVLVAVLGGLMALWLVSTTSKTTRVVVAATDLEPSRPVTEADFRVVEVGLAPGVESVAADEQSVVVGLMPRARIAAGTMVAESMFAAVDEVVPAGNVMVSAQLRSGAVPASVAADDSVVLIDVTESAAKVIGRARVFQVERPDGVGGDVELSLVVAEDLQVPVAAAAAGEVLRVGIVGS